MGGDPIMLKVPNPNYLSTIEVYHSQQRDLYGVPINSIEIIISKLLMGSPWSNWVEQARLELELNRVSLIPKLSVGEDPIYLY